MISTEIDNEGGGLVDLIFSYPAESREQAAEQLRRLTEGVEPSYQWN